MIDIWNYRDFIEITESAGIIDFRTGFGEMYRIKQVALQGGRKNNEEKKTPCIERHPASICDYYLHEPEISQTPIAAIEHLNLNEEPFSCSVFIMPLGALIEKLKG